MINAISCGGVVIHRGKILLLYKNQNGKYTAWVLPKGTKEEGESFEETALREVKEEGSVDAEIIKYIGKTQYSFKVYRKKINKVVHWYMMNTRSYFSKPQAEEFFTDSGYYSYHEAYHLLKFDDEKRILKKVYFEYNELRKTEQFINSFLKKRNKQ